jgi:imidazoleglycerol-phosphate dehydratase
MAQRELLARLDVAGSGEARVATGVSVLDHLIGVLARYASFDLTLEVAPAEAGEEVTTAGRALGEALRSPLRASGARGHGTAALPEGEALASVSLDISDQPFVASNVDLSSVHVAGLETDLVAAFLEELVEGAEMTVHMRLVEGSDEQHVLDAIFKALGAALEQACEKRSRPRRRKKT